MDIYSRKNNELKVVFLDIGQGDAILIQTPFGQDILIDGGPGTKIIHELDKHMGFWNRDIELMILTHPHADHVDGLVEVLKRYEVEKVLGYEINYNYSAFHEWLRLIKEKEIPFNRTKVGDKFILGENLFLETLYPFSDITGQEFKDVNDASIINRLCYFETCFVLTGDASKEMELDLVNSGLNIKAEVLKVGHHGSKYSSDEAFLKLVNPKYAIIQSGKDNKHGHPHYITLKRLIDSGAEILRNDEKGEIICHTDGVILDCS